MIKKWYVYLLLCSDNSIYCGSTNALQKRILAHNEGKSGAKYTKSRRPVKLLKSFEVNSKSEALKLEYRIKQMSKAEKLAL